MRTNRIMRLLNSEVFTWLAIILAFIGLIACLIVGDGGP